MVSQPTLTACRPTLCYVTDRKALAAPSWPNPIEKIRLAIDAGVDWIQIREKDLPARELFILVQEAVRIAGAASGRTRIILNDHLDIALAAGAAGVHLGRESAAASSVVPWCRSGNAPPEFLIGASCHQGGEALEAARSGASYLFFGPVYDTPSKRRFGPAQGIARLAGVCAAVTIPVMAIGGLNEENAGEALKAGAAGIAAIRMFQQAIDAASLKDSIDRMHRISRQ